jgi:peroxiredoxin
MKRNIAFLLLLIGHGFISCRNAGKDTRVLTSTTNSKDTTDSRNEIYRIDADALLKDFMTWYKYTYYNIRLAQDFIAEDQSSNLIDKTRFLQYLSTGDFVALKTAKKNNVFVYQLLKREHLQTDIKNTMVQLAETAITLENMEGKELPAYHFTDLDAKIYSNENTKGNVILIKCWFINCSACVKEFPQLNQLVDRFKKRTDVKFISLASDSRADLTTFVKRKPFNYAVVPEVGKYMTEQLKVNAYPLHLLVNKEGKVVKATNSLEDMLPYFEKEAG